MALSILFRSYAGICVCEAAFDACDDALRRNRYWPVGSCPILRKEGRKIAPIRGCNVGDYHANDIAVTGQLSTAC